MRVLIPLSLLFVLLAPFAAHAGEADRAKIIGTIKKRMPSFQLCYDDAQKRKGQLGGGKVTVAFDVGPDGRVTASRVTQDSLKDPEVGCCAALLLRRIRFEAPGGTVHESFPFVFVNPNAPGRPPANPPPPTTYCKDLAALDAAAPASAP